MNQLKNQRNRITIPGQSVSEYAVVFGLVVVIAIAGVVVLGSQNDELIQNANRQLFQTQADGSGATGKMTTLLAQQNNSRAVTVTLGDGTTLSLNRYPINLVESVQTASSDGTSRNLSLTIHDIALQLLQAGKITESEFNIMEGLANSGHRLADLEGLIRESAETARGVSQDPEQMKLSFRERSLLVDGKEISVDELSCSMGGAGQNDSYCGQFSVPIEQLTAEVREDLKWQLDGMSSVGVDRAKFLTEYAKVLNIPAVKNDPVLSQVLKSLTFQISSLSQVTGTVANNMLDPNKLEITPVTMNQSMAERLIDHNASSICNLGSTTDTGVHCPKT